MAIRYTPVDYGATLGLAPEQTNDYVTGMDPQKILRDPRFLDDLRKERAAKGKNPDLSDDELIDWFYENRAWANMNTVGMAADIMNSRTDGDERGARLRRMQEVWTRLPMRSLTDPELYKDAALPLLTDPLNAFGGAGAARAGIAGAVQGVRGLAAAKNIALAGAKSEALAGGVTGAIQGVVGEARDAELNIDGGFSGADVLESAGFGTLLGGAAGGVLAGALSKPISASGERLVAAAKNLGYTQEQLAGMSAKQIEQAVAKGITAPSDAAMSPVEAGTDGLQDVVAEQPEATESKVFLDSFDPAIPAQARAYAEDALDSAIESGAPPSVIKEARAAVVTAREMEQLAQVIVAYEKNTAALLGSDDAAKAAIGKRNAARSAELQSWYRLAEKDPSILVRRAEELQAKLAAAKTELAQQQPVVTEAAAPGSSTEAKTAEGQPTETPAETAAAPAAAPAAQAAAPAKTGRRRNKAEAAPTAGSPLPEGVTPLPDGTLGTLAPDEAVEVPPEAPRALQDKYNEVLDQFGDDINNPERIPGIMKFVEATYGEDAEGIFELLRQDIADALKNAGDISPPSPEMALNRGMDRKVLEAILRQLTTDAAKARGASPEVAQAVADKAAARAAATGADQMGARAKRPAAPAEPQERSGTGRAAETLATGPVTAGRNATTGKVQGVLKPGRATERDADGNVVRTITEGDVPDARKLSRTITEKERNSVIRLHGPDLIRALAKMVSPEDAKAEGKTVAEVMQAIIRDIHKREMGEEEAVILANKTKDVVSFIAPKGGKKGVIGAPPRVGKRKDGAEFSIPGFVWGGTEIYYEPKTRRFYLNQQDAAKANGLGGGKKYTPLTEAEKEALRKKAADARAKEAADRNAEVDKKLAEEDAKAAKLAERRARAEARRAGQPEAPPTEAAPEPDTPTPEEVVDEVVDEVADTAPVSKEEAVEAAKKRYFDALAAGEDPVVAARRLAKETRDIQNSGVPNAPEPSSERTLAIRRKGKPNEIRVLSAAQRESGAGVGALLGKSSIDDWEIGSVPVGSRSTTRGIKDFVPATEDEILAANTPDPDLPRGMSWEDAAAPSLKLTAEETNELRGIAAMIGLNVAPDIFERPRQIEFLAQTLDYFGWPSNRAGLAKLTSALKTVYAALDKHVPNGFIRPTQAREEALAAIERIFADSPAEELAAAHRFINNLAGEGSPIFITDGEGLRYKGGDNTIQLSSGDFSVRPALPRKQTSRLEVLYHEVAHWAYRNILTHQDRMEFWSAMEKYYAQGPDGKPVFAAVEDRVIPYEMGGPANALQSPQEFFANQFTAWVMTKKERLLWQDETFWQKVTRYVKAVFDRFFADDFIDPDLEPLFAKILPDPEMYARSGPTDNPKLPTQTEQGAAIRTHFYLLRDAHDALKSALNADDAEGARDAAMTLMYRLLYLAPKSNTKTGKTGIFGPLRGYHKYIQNVSWRIRQAISTDEGDAAKFYDLSNVEDAGISAEEIADIGGIKSMDEGVLERLRKLATEGDEDFGTAGSLDSAVELVTGLLNQQFRRKEGRNLVPRSIRKNEASPAGPENNKVLKRAQRLDVSGKAAVEEEAKRIAEAAAKGEDAAPTAAPKGEAHPDVESSPRSGWDIEQLIVAHAKTKSAASRRKMAEAILHKLRATPAPITQEEMNAAPISREVFGLRSKGDGNNTLASALDAALKKGDAKKANEIMFEAWRRSSNDRAKKAGEPLLRATIYNSLVSDLVSRERDWRANSWAETDGRNVAPRSATVSNIAASVSARTPEQTEIARTLVTRVLNALNPQIKGGLEQANLFSIEDLYRLTGQEPPTEAVGGAFVDLTHSAYTSLRSHLRKISIGLTEGKTGPMDAVHEVMHLAVRSNVFSPEDRGLIVASFREAAERGDKLALNRLEQYGKKPLAELSERDLKMVAEEWFVEGAAQYATGRYAYGDMWKVRDGGAISLKGPLMQTLTKLWETTAYFLNGLVGRNDIKQMYRRLFIYGDMFGNKGGRPRNSILRPEEAAIEAYGRFNLMSPERFARVREAVRGTLSDVGDMGMFRFPRIFYHGSPSSDLLRAPGAVMRPSSYGKAGPGIYLSDNPHVSDQTFAQRPTSGAVTNLIVRLVQEGKIHPEDAEDAVSAAEKISSLEAQYSVAAATLAEARIKVRAKPPKVGRALHDLIYLSESEYAALEAKVSSLSEKISQGYEALRDVGYEDAPGTFPVLILAKKPLDFSEDSANYNVGTADVVAMLKAVMEELDFSQEFGSSMMKFLEGDRYYEMLDAKQKAVEIIENEWRDKLGSGADAVVSIVRALVESGYDNMAHESIVGGLVFDAAAKLGFDSIIVDSYSTLPGGQQIPFKEYVVIDHYDPVADRMVSASELVKSIDAVEFDSYDPRFYHSKLSKMPDINAPLISALMENPDAKMGGNTMPLSLIMDSAGVPEPTAELMNSIWRQKVPDATTKKNGVTTINALLSSQASRLKKSGMNWLSDFMADHFIDHASEVGRKVLPIKSLLDALPDTPKGFSRWLKHSNPLGPGEQPASHARIVRALRFGLSSPEAARLSPQERAVAMRIRTEFDAELESMRRSGVVVGNIRNYFPQLWNVEAIQKEPEKFERGLARYFLEEAKRDGRAKTVAEARASAQSVMSRLIEEDGYHVPPPIGASREPTSDHADFQRLIRLDDPLFRSNLTEMMPFLQDDLEGILVRYYDQTVRKRLLAKNFGTLSHGFYDYLRVVEEGEEGIAYLLTHNRVARKDIRSYSPDGYATVVQLSDEERMPFADDEAGGRAAAKELIKTYRERGEASAFNMLMGMNPNRPDKRATPPERSPYEQRARAIIAALRDFNGEGRQVPSEEMMFAQSALRLAMRKPVSEASQRVRNFSSAVRTFNAVSLLAFTTLASIPDVVLPSITSGSMRTHLRALWKYRSDPDYRMAIQNTGVAIESILHQRMAGLYASDVTGAAGRASNAFFNATMLTPWTDLNRKIAAAVGHEMFNVDIKKASRLRVGDGMNLEAQPPEYKRIMRRLNHYGLADFVYNNEMITDISDPRVTKALIRFANDTIFSPNPNDIPMWGQTPVGAMVFQLKSFPLMMTRLARDVLVNDVKMAIRTGDVSYLKRPAYFLTLGPAAGAISLGVRDLVQQRGGEEKNEPSLRNRNVLQMLGYDEKVHGNQDDFLGWYLEGMLAMGGLGLVGDLFHTTASQLDNGAYGQQRILSAVLGPSVSTLVTLPFNTASGAVAAIAGPDDRNSRERTAVRELVSRVPVAGGVGSIREGVVNAVAGERMTGGGGGGGQEAASFDGPAFAEDDLPPEMPMDSGEAVMPEV